MYGAGEAAGGERPRGPSVLVGDWTEREEPGAGALPSPSRTPMLSNLAAVSGCLSPLSPCKYQLVSGGKPLRADAAILGLITLNLVLI